MVITEIRADELIPGDIIDTKCGIGEYAWGEVVSVRVEENEAPGAQDRIVFEFIDTIGDVRGRTTRRTLAGSMFRTRVA